jgi:hypothetical protein
MDDSDLITYFGLLLDKKYNDTVPQSTIARLLTVDYHLIEPSAPSLAQLEQGSQNPHENNMIMLASNNNIKIEESKNQTDVIPKKLVVENNSNKHLVFDKDTNHKIISDIPEKELISHFDHFIECTNKKKEKEVILLNNNNKESKEVNLLNNNNKESKEVNLLNNNNKESKEVILPDNNKENTDISVIIPIDLVISATTVVDLKADILHPDILNQLNVELLDGPNIPDKILFDTIAIIITCKKELNINELEMREIFKNFCTKYSELYELLTRGVGLPKELLNEPTKLPEYVALLQQTEETQSHTHWTKTMEIFLRKFQNNEKTLKKKNKVKKNII